MLGDRRKKASLLKGVTNIGRGRGVENSWREEGKGRVYTKEKIETDKNNKQKGVRKRGDVKCVWGVG